MPLDLSQYRSSGVRSLIKNSRSQYVPPLNTVPQADSVYVSGIGAMEIGSTFIVEPGGIGLIKIGSTFTIK